MTGPALDPAVARVRAECCFASARAATLDAHRDDWIRRGEALVLGAGLDLDDFDIPGRWRPGQARA